MVNERDIVVIGGSAGAYPALNDLLAGLPANLPASVFVVLHMMQAYSSQLARRLQGWGHMPACFPDDGQPIVRGQIYVAPPDWNMFMELGRVRVLPSPREHLSRPGINTLFRSAALAYGRRVIGVVLSGLMNDGAAACGRSSGGAASPSCKIPQRRVIPTCRTRSSRASRSTSPSAPRTSGWWSRAW